MLLSCLSVVVSHAKRSHCSLRTNCCCSYVLAMVLQLNAASSTKYFPRNLAIPQAMHFLSAVFLRYPTNSSSVCVCVCVCDRSVVRVCNTGSFKKIWTIKTRSREEYHITTDQIWRTIHCWMEPHATITVVLGNSLTRLCRIDGLEEQSTMINIF